MIVRPGLPPGLMASMVVHAAGESAALRAPPPDCHAVVLVAPEPELRRLAAKLRDQGFEPREVVEDAPPFAGQLMALGVPPASDGVQRWLKHLPLLREGHVLRE